MFRTVPLSIIRSFSLYTQQLHMSYRFVDSLRAVSGRKPTRCTNLRNCPKHAEFYSNNKYEKLVHLVGFIIIIYHDVRSLERQIHITPWNTMYWSMYWHDITSACIWVVPLSNIGQCSRRLLQTFCGIPLVRQKYNFNCCLVFRKLHIY